MTVAELIATLKGLPTDLEVILQKDREGNNYSPLDSVDANAIYEPDTDWSGHVFWTDWDAEDVDLSQKAWDAYKAANPRCCVLQPIN